MSRSRWVPFVLGALGLLALAGGPTASACSIPVFRYALERWPAEPYQAVVFHKGPLKPDEEKLVDGLRKAGTADAPANLAVVCVDVAGKLEKQAEALWKREGVAETPWVVVLYPFGLGVEEKAWAGRLDAARPAALADSPARRALVKGLVGGDCAVWLLVQSGDKAKDDAVGKLLRDELKKLEALIELPTPMDFGFGDEPPLAEGEPPAGENALKVSFSLVRVSRADKAEQAFLDLLLSVDLELKNEKEPMAFAIFGQGRALPALIGAGINADNITDVCAFICGPCSCQVKAMNPGWDLLVSADWAAVFDGPLVREPEEPVLTGSVHAPAPKEEVPSAAPPAPAPPPAKARSPLLRNTLLAVAAGVLILAIGSFALLRRSGRREQ
ncbi:MAG TPA: hypothetical protein VNE39_08845 [Planctomycetota bacterium]|nr:hypothetical protein [Planctomycetota bacterium]